MDEPDLELLDRWCGGDVAAGNTLFKRHFDLVYRFFEHKADGELDDLVQETFMGCLRGRETFRRQSSFRTYLLAIARHVLFGYWRRRATARRAIDFDEVSVASLSTSVGTRLAKQEARVAMLEALRSLPLEQQVLLEMYYWEELDRGALAEVFDVEQATIGSRLFRARQQLHAALERVGAPQVGDVDFDQWARGLRRAPQLRPIAGGD